MTALLLVTEVKASNAPDSREASAYRVARTARVQDVQRQRKGLRLARIEYETTTCGYADGVQFVTVARAENYQKVPGRLGQNPVQAESRRSFRLRGAFTGVSHFGGREGNKLVSKLTRYRLDNWGLDEPLAECFK
jgi:hypothetical protein